MADPVLIVFAHPALEKSRVNRHLIRAVQDLEGVTVRDLYECYPEFDIDVEREKSSLLEHDLIVLQHPFYWYSTPALLKEWEDLVLEHGWAYGHGGDALRGKRMLSAITTGGGETSYCRQGYNRHTVRELLAPIEQTALLCGMQYLPPFVVHGTHALDEHGALVHAQEYARTIGALRDGRVDLRAAAEHPRLNYDLDSILSSS